MHQISRVRHELRRRSLRVRASEFVTPNMLRITLEGPELEGFTSLDADDHIKLFVPGDRAEIERRDYTPRRYDAAAGELVVDFALHEAGPATEWARNARPGDAAEIGGPRGSVVVPDDFDWWLLIGDETALPAIGRRVEELGPGRQVISVVAVTGAEEIQIFDTAASHRALWVERPAGKADDPAPIVEALRGLTLPEGDGFVWIAAEARVARAARNFVLKDFGHPPKWMKASGYWVKGQSDAHEKFER